MKFALALFFIVALNPAAKADRTAPIKLDPKDPCATLALPEDSRSAAYRRFDEVWKTKSDRAKELAKGACLDGAGRGITASLAIATKEVKELLADPFHRFYYVNYLKSGYLGGFGYADERVTEMGANFLYPQVYWLFSDEAPEYHKAVYGKADVEKQPVTKFAYAGAYFPSTSLVQAAADSSVLAAPAREAFRSGVSYLASELVARMKKDLDKKGLLAYEIVITHYESYGAQAIVLEGFTAGTPKLSFKSYVDLEDDEADVVFIPSDQTPTKEEAKSLVTLNGYITDLGGDPLRSLKKPARTPIALPLFPNR